MSNKNFAYYFSILVGLSLLASTSYNRMLPSLRQMATITEYSPQLSISSNFSLANDKKSSTLSAQEGISKVVWLLSFPNSVGYRMRVY